MNAVAQPIAATTDRIWLNSYPDGVPAEIDPDSFASINDVFDQACTKYRNSPGFTCMGKTLTYGELDELARALAGYLLGTLKLAKGDRVAVMMPNILQYPVAVFGILRAGLTVVNCNPLYTPRELEHQLKDSGAKAIIIVENFATTLEQVIAKTDVKQAITTQLGDMLGFPKSLLVNYLVKHKKKLVPPWKLPASISMKAALSAGRSASFDLPKMANTDLAFLQYTGGTTGVSKGAMLTHRNLVANMEQVGAWTAGGLDEGREVVIQPLPLYHIFALS